MCCYSTKSFGSTVLKLLKKKEQYGSVLTDIKLSISDKSFSEIKNNSDLILETSDKRISVIKLRIPNSTMKKGTRGGYRLIAVIDHVKQYLSLIHIYPKIGKLGIENVSKQDILKSYLTEYIHEEKIGLIRKHYFHEFEEKFADTHTGHYMAD